MPERKITIHVSPEAVDSLGQGGHPDTIGQSILNKATSIIMRTFGFFGGETKIELLGDEKVYPADKLLPFQIHFYENGVEQDGQEGTLEIHGDGFDSLN